MAFASWLILGLFLQMIEFKEPTIQTYTIGEYATDPINLLDQKFFAVIRIMGFEENRIDPRAGRLEVTELDEEGQIIRDWRKLQLCELSDEFFENYLKKPWGINRHFCLPTDTYLDGVLEEGGAIVPLIRLAKCNQEDLLDGEACMDDNELANYYFKKKISFRASHTFVDYDDIDVPLK